jgi:hypothetical protein
MGGDWISFPQLLICCWACLLLLLALNYRWRLVLPRVHSILPLLLLAAGLYQHAALLQLAARCETALLATAPASFLQRTFDLPLS